MDSVLPPNTLVVFTSSPTGLGHIRVMNALIGGLPPGSTYKIVGVKDVNAAKIHALGSRIKILEKLTEFVQYNPTLESIVTKIYQIFFSSRTKKLTEELVKIREEYPDIDNWIVVSTHFALAYPVVTIKKTFKKRFGINIYNILTVTDDSPQRIWAANGTNIIFTPSNLTEQAIRDFLPKDTQTSVETVSFPVSPRLTQTLSDEELTFVENQLDPAMNIPLHLSIPVSGAAVQLDFLESLIKELTKGQFVCTVIGQITPFTTTFFEHLKNIPRAQISAGNSANMTVKLYESAFYQKSRPAVEVTKPSEQTFKAILKPSERGGVIMLLTDPVGRQEHDNFHFLLRHLLVPDRDEELILDRYLLKGIATTEEKNMLHYKASHWRALKLPSDPMLASTFIKRAKQEGILHTMLAYVPETKRDLTSDGVAQIWSATIEMVKYQSQQAES